MKKKCTVSWMISGTALASTWNEELAEKVGDTLGMEGSRARKDIILAPGINIHRTPLCGRNFEYMSEDPYLCGKLVARQIKGIQKMMLPHASNILHLTIRKLIVWKLM